MKFLHVQVQDKGSDFHYPWSNNPSHQSAERNRRSTKGVHFRRSHGSQQSRYWEKLRTVTVKRKVFSNHFSHVVSHLMRNFYQKESIDRKLFDPICLRIGLSPKFPSPKIDRMKRWKNVVMKLKCSVNGIWDFIKKNISLILEVLIII